MTFALGVRMTIEVRRTEGTFYQAKRTIKEVYNCAYIVSDKELYPLEKWYNILIDKRVDEITIADVSRMIRQDVVMELAMTKAMDFLQGDVFAGEMYDGQLLENISRLDAVLLTSYSEKLKAILKDALEKSETHEWSYEEEKEEFIGIVKIISKKLFL